MFGDIYSGKKVLVTGHTGFKGSWLALWLKKLGANVCGLALEPETEPNHFQLLNLPVRTEIADIRDRGAVESVFRSFQPEIVFHLAAQPIVRTSYQFPVETFSTNVLGTVHVLEACRNTPSVRAAVVITSDKCYHNRETMEGYAESDPLGGFDPYSASKGCAEIVAAAYRNAFCSADNSLLIATARAGNVIGGGDWGKDRLVPDAMRAAEEGEAVFLRNPASVRPWQHVLEPLSGYLMLGWKLAAGERNFADSWNFGPEESGIITVQRAVELLNAGWNAVRAELGEPDPAAPHEARLLRLNCSKAHQFLGWFPVWEAPEAFRRTAVWYRDYCSAYKLNTEKDLQAYLDDAVSKNLPWTF